MAIMRSSIGPEARRRCAAASTVLPFTKACLHGLSLGHEGRHPHTGFNRVVEAGAIGLHHESCFPAPCGGRDYGLSHDRLPARRAAQVPDRVSADGNGGSTLPSIGGYRDGKAFVFVETMMGVWSDDRT